MHERMTLWCEEYCHGGEDADGHRHDDAAIDHDHGRQFRHPGKARDTPEIPREERPLRSLRSRSLQDQAHDYRRDDEDFEGQAKGSDYGYPVAQGNKGQGQEEDRDPQERKRRALPRSGKSKSLPGSSLRVLPCLKDDTVLVECARGLLGSKAARHDRSHGGMLGSPLTASLVSETAFLLGHLEGVRHGSTLWQRRARDRSSHDRIAADADVRRHVSSPIENADDQTCAGTGSLRKRSMT